MPSGKQVITLQVSNDLKEKLDTLAGQSNVALSEWIRRAICKAADWPITKETVQRGKPKKYATKELAKEAAKEQRKERQALANRLLKEYQEKQKQEAINALASSLEQKGEASSKAKKSGKNSKAGASNA